ncbi:MAG: thermonuclease family protein [Proteobacteria bacterium]|nr:thermonuclease family protein [Pseudomonadota bacterium]
MGCHEGNSEATDTETNPGSESGNINPSGDGAQCPTGQHVYETICEADDMQNCGGHGIVCTSDQQCQNGGCQPNGNDPNPVETPLNCQSGQHLYGDSCEPDDMLNCGGHGIACTSDQQCLNGGCKPQDTAPTPVVQCQDGQHAYGDNCEPDDMLNCGAHGIACTSDQQCLNGSCKLKDTEPTPVVQCPDGQHAYGDNCEPDDMQNCGSHGKSCKWSQHCEDGTCQNIPCHYSTKWSERSPGLCVENHMLVCGKDSFYYYDSKNGNCSEQNPCTVCPDGYAGCTNDESTFCKNHQTSTETVPKACISKVYPPQCVNNTGYICGDNNQYYSSASTRCSGTNKCVICQSGFIGCSSNPKEFCEAKNSAPVTDPNQCTVGHRRCEGFNLMECDGTSYSTLIENCYHYCEDGTDGSNSSCSSYWPDCTIKNGSSARIIGWNDGDTLIVLPESEDSSCYPTRHTIRVYYIDSPECSKKQNKYYSNIMTCIQDNIYTSTNDPYGYEAWEAVTSMANSDTFVRLYCDNADEYNNCPVESNGRYLAYVSVDKLDISTELTRLGLAIPTLGRIAVQSEREKAICNALFEAVKARRNLWSTCTTTDGQCIRDVAAKLKSTKGEEFDYIYERCQYITGSDVSTDPQEPVCTPGTDVCMTNMLYSCSNEGQLEFLKNCPYGCANDHACASSSEIECTPGDSKCINQKMYYCNENEELIYLKDCTSPCINDSTCSSAPGIDYCVNDVHYFWQEKNGSPYLKSEACYNGCYENSCQCTEASNCASSEAKLCVDNRCQFPKNVSCKKNISPALCGADGDAYFCDTAGYYYHGKTCDSSSECYVCPNGYGGCTNDPESFCKY